MLFGISRPGIAARPIRQKAATSAVVEPEDRLHQLVHDCVREPLAAARTGAVARLPRVLVTWIWGYLFNPLAVADAFIVGGLLIIWAERQRHLIRVPGVDEMDRGGVLQLGLPRPWP